MELEHWMQRYLQMVHALFGARICCVGLQGSCGRGEAGPESDIDVVLILDQVSMVDLERYRAAAEALPQREKLCGFVSGRRELEHWDRAELISFYYDTTPIEGDLNFCARRMCGGLCWRAPAASIMPAPTTIYIHAAKNWFSSCRRRRFSPCALRTLNEPAYLSSRGRA